MLCEGGTIMPAKFFPIIKWKTGEKNALSQLIYNMPDIMPVIQIIDGTDPAEFFRQLNNVFPHPVYIDTSVHDEDDINCSILSNYIQFAQRNNIPAYPILDYQSIHNIPIGTTNVAVYLPVPSDIGIDITTIMQMINSHTNGMKVDIFLNAGVILEQNVNLIYFAYKTMLSELIPLCQHINNFVICLTSFPESISCVQSGQTAAFQRFDISIFRDIRKMYNQIKEKINYSDYGVTKYTESELDFSRMGHAILPKVRYTTDSLYFVMKGANKPKITYVDLAKELVSTQYYQQYGHAFCYGDREIYLKAQGDNGIGNNTNWVTYCCNHHLSVVLTQLSMLP